MPRLPIIAFAKTCWNSLWMNRQHLLHRIAAGGRRVAYSNGVNHYSQFGKIPFLQHPAQMDSVTVMKNGYFLPSTHARTLLRRASVWHHCGRIRQALGVAPGSPVIGMCFDPELIDYIDVLDPTLRIFHIYDSYNKMQDSTQDFEPFRQRILQFDLITASSAFMYRDVTGREPDARVIVPNGVDYEQFVSEAFEPSPTAEKINALPGPRVGYVGSTNTKIDFVLVTELATACPDASFIFVGPVRYYLLEKHAEELANFERLQRLPNVYFFDTVPKEELPAVVNALDIGCIFSNVKNCDWVAAQYPLKLNEYLAKGLPVISSGIRIIQEDFQDVVTECNSRDEWISAIRQHAKAPRAEADVAARREVAAHNDWSIRVSQIESLLAELSA
jgi:glycosyltransferase involved in cell wall biosynthesis